MPARTGLRIYSLVIPSGDLLDSFPINPPPVQNWFLRTVHIFFLSVHLISPIPNSELLSLFQSVSLLRPKLSNRNGSLYFAVCYVWFRTQIVDISTCPIIDIYIVQFCSWQPFHSLLVVCDFEMEQLSWHSSMPCTPTYLAQMMLEITVCRTGLFRLSDSIVGFPSVSSSCCYCRHIQVEDCKH